VLYAYLQVSFLCVLKFVWFIIICLVLILLKCTVLDTDENDIFLPAIVCQDLEIILK